MGRPILRLAIGGMLALSLVACATHGPTRRDAAGGVARAGGEIAIYLEPLPREADGLTIEIGSVSAIAEDGSPWPLEVVGRRFVGGAQARQALLAVGSLPAGTYQGLIIAPSRVTRASSQGAGVLALADPPSIAEIEFVVERGRAVLLSARLSPHALVGPDVRFEAPFVVGSPAPGTLAPAATALAALPERNLVAVFHKRSGEVLQLLATGARPAAVAYDPLRGRVYVACAGADTVEAYDLVRGIREHSVPLSAGDRASAVALSRDGRTLVVASSAAAAVTVFDAPTLSQRHRIAVGRDPVFTTFAPDDGTVLVVERGDFGVAVIDPERGVVIGRVQTESGPTAIAFDRPGTRLVVVHRDSPNLLVVRFPALSVERHAYVGPGGAAVAVDPRTDRVFLARRGSRKIEVFDPGSWLPVDSVDVGGDVTFLAIDRDEGAMLAAVPATGEVRIVQSSTNQVSGVAEFGAVPTWIEVAGGGATAR